MAKISAVISAYNEEDNIERCLRSLKFVDELVVVDNSSTDSTAKIAKKYADVVYTQKNDSQKIDLQKNFGFEKATSDWILSVDADEEISPELAKEITFILSSKASSISDISGFWIPRKNILFGKWIEYAGWYPDPQLRLFRKGKAKYTKKHVHESLSIDGQTAKLKEHIVHYNYDSVAQFVSKSTTYAQNEADDLLDKGYQFSFFDAIRFPIGEFLSRFFARKGYKDGLHGLVISLLMAFYHFLIFAFIWEDKKFPQYNNENFLSETDKELKQTIKDISFWMTKEKLEKTENPLKKGIIKIKSRL